MPFRFKVLFGLFLLLPDLVFGQKNEEELPATAFSATHPEVQFWENYFQEKYISKGISAESLGEGTGFLPYLRAWRFYDLRKDFRGEVELANRWEVLKKIRAEANERDGPSPVANWQSLGPNKMEEMGGRMISHDFESGNSKVIWAGSASGDSWQPMSDQIPSTGIGAVAVNPKNPRSLLIGTGEGYAIGVSSRPGLGVFKSVSRGLTWSPRPTDFGKVPTLAQLGF